MDGFTLLLFAALFLAGSVIYLSRHPRPRAIVLSRLPLRRYRASGAQTPPLSLSPGKTPAADPAAAGYTAAFPPSRRSALADIDPGASALLRDAQRDLDTSPPDSRTRLIPWGIPIDQLSAPAYTATEFSTAEIAALGDFPDYAALSGIPLPQAYEEFDIRTAIARPYRPFRWAYHQTMSLKKLEHDWWLELNRNYVEQVRQRMELYATNGGSVLRCLPGCEFACKELMEMVIQFLCARYPHYFRLDAARRVFSNALLDTETDLARERPLDFLMNNVPEDFALMLRNPDDGFYYFRGGVICSSLGWDLGSKIGMQLREIHEPIPDYREKMQFSMDRYFSKKPTDKAIQRGSWGLEVDEPLYMPPGDPHERHREEQSPALDLARCHLRVDWQTLRRLPLSGAVVFNFKALFTPVQEFRDEAYVPALVLKVLKEGKKSIMEYKSTWHTEHVVVPALEAYAREQVERGLVPEDWEPQTLDETPLFPGWEEKWHRQQGF